jgi:hypothetical protein
MQIRRLEKYDAIQNQFTSEKQDLGPCGTTNKKITTKCIYKLKPRTHAKQDKLKAKFMVQGFEQCARIDYYDTFALVVK